ncbi:MAG: uroporphyrinogen-III C-methyltransferase, partial [Terriglobales bacterium]
MRKSAPGKVWLVGAGPGDPELLTLKARRVLAAAGVVVYDELVHAAILEHAPKACERVYVGKRERHHALPQEEIAALMIARARDGRSVVRLKGGDPFLFGRGGEEADQLAAAGVAWEVVPGVSAGLAVPAAAGIPLTQRGLASAVVFRAGHRCAEAEAENRPEPRPTQVVFMGLGRLAAIAQELVAEGWPPETPAAVISQGTLAAQRVVVAPLAAIAARVAEAALPSPALIVVGEVVRCRERWLAAASA